MSATAAAPRVLLLCGGASAEHEVSIASARSVLEAAGDLDITPLVIDRHGRVLPPAASQRALALGRAPDDCNGVSLAQLDLFAADNSPALATAAPDARRFDVVFPLLHGPNGEDGTVQGLLALLDLPHVGSGVLGSAVGMDKLMMKAVFAAAGLPQVRYAGVTRRRWQDEPAQVLDELAQLEPPLFVKPANLGSSVGISRVDRHDDLPAALGLAARYDRRIIVEEGARGARELEVAVLGNDAPAASPVGEIRHQAAFYDYQTKYVEGKAELCIPADVPADVAERCRSLALDAFRAIDAAGLARVDFFYLPASDEVLLNEINTMPGFTRTSMYPLLWQAAGLSYPDLIGKLVTLALERR